VTQLIALYACRTVIIEKHYRTVIPRSVVDYFMAEVSKKSVKAGGSEEEEEAVEAVPVMSLPKLILVHIHRNDLYYLAVLTGEGLFLSSPPLTLILILIPFMISVSPLMVIEFLHRTADIFAEYFGEVNEHSIKDNFVTVYQVLLILILFILLCLYQ